MKRLYELFDSEYSSVWLLTLGSLLLMLSSALAISHARPLVDDPDDVMTFYRRLVAFDQKYQPMINTACGFEGQTPPEHPTCSPAAGRIDARQFAEATEQAKKLFVLTDKKKDCR